MYLETREIPYTYTLRYAELEIRIRIWSAIQ